MHTHIGMSFDRYSKLSKLKPRASVESVIWNTDRFIVKTCKCEYVCIHTETNTLQTWNHAAYPMQSIAILWHFPKQYYTIAWSWVEGSDWLKVLFLGLSFISCWEYLHDHKVIYFLPEPGLEKKRIAIFKHIKKWLEGHKIADICLNKL